MNGRRNIRVEILLTTKARPHKVLQVRTAHTGAWGLPRTFVRDGEPISSAADRVMLDQLRLQLLLIRTLCVDHVPSKGPDGEPDTLTMVLDGGQVSGRTAKLLERAPKSDRRLSPLRWAALEDFENAPRVVQHAITVRLTDRLPTAVLTDGLSDIEMRTGYGPDELPAQVH